MFLISWKIESFKWSVRWSYFHIFDRIVLVFYFVQREINSRCATRFRLLHIVYIYQYFHLSVACHLRRWGYKLWIYFSADFISFIFFSARLFYRRTLLHRNGGCFTSNFITKRFHIPRTLFCLYHFIFNSYYLQWCEFDAPTTFRWHEIIEIERNEAKTKENVSLSFDFVLAFCYWCLCNSKLIAVIWPSSIRQIKMNRRKLSTISDLNFNSTLFNGLFRIQKNIEWNALLDLFSFSFSIQTMTFDSSFC